MINTGRQATSARPPVFIILCRDTALAKELYDWLANGASLYGAAPEQFRNAPGLEWTVRVDSKVPWGLILNHPGFS
jgi:hypothetical protein